MVWVGGYCEGRGRPGLEAPMGRAAHSQLSANVQEAFYIKTEETREDGMWLPR